MSRQVYIILSALALMAGCRTSTGLFPEMENLLDGRRTEIVFRDAHFDDVMDFINYFYAGAENREDWCIVSSLTLQEQADTPSMNINHTNATLRVLLELVEKEAFVKINTVGSKIVLVPDNDARKLYANTYAKELANADKVLSDALSDLRMARVIELWDPDERESVTVAGDKKEADAIIKWIQDQPKGYDKNDSDERAKGTVCGCLPWFIEFGEPKQDISIHSHNLIINGVTSFKPARSFNLDSFREHLIKAGVINRGK